MYWLVGWLDGWTVGQMDGQSLSLLYILYIGSFYFFLNSFLFFYSTFFSFIIPFLFFVYFVLSASYNSLHIVVEVQPQNHPD